MTAPDWVQFLIPFAQAFGPAIGWVVVIIGWKIVSKDNDRRERRKELRVLLNDARVVTIELERSAYAYYQKSAKESNELGMQIKRELQHLANMLAVIKKINGKLDFDAQLSGLRQKLTGQDFDSAARGPRNHSDRLFLEISTVALELTSAFEDKFNSAYP